MRSRVLLLTCCAVFAASAQTGPAARQIGSAITAEGLKADISFLASDAMKGRGTPSPEQDIAAEYIASEFRRVGLEPVGDDGYFQTAKLESVISGTAPVELTLEINGQPFKVDRAAMMSVREAPLTLDSVEAARASALTTPEAIEQAKGKPLIMDTAGGRVVYGSATALTVLLTDPPQQQTQAAGRITLRTAGSAPGNGGAVLAIWDANVRKALKDAPAAVVKITARIGEPATKPVSLRNVVGLLRGSDPALKDTVLIVSAHYDHLGVRAGEGDTIFNGANDNASGTAAMIETGHALAGLPERPKRSILFLALFGEEVGEVGSAWYAKHPLFPLEKTVADINLEQLGRTDDSEGPRLKQFNLTGFDYSDIAAAFVSAGKEFGVEAVKHPKNSDSFFGRSDNMAFSMVGVPSTTASVTYIFPDYHAVGDEWAKLDYANMALVTRTLALGVLRLADSPEAPQWNAQNPKTARYVKVRTTPAESK